MTEPSVDLVALDKALRRARLRWGGGLALLLALPVQVVSFAWLPRVAGFLVIAHLATSVTLTVVGLGRASEVKRARRLARRALPQLPAARIVDGD